ncbi:hypothetical protein MMC07_007801 [Pseudocyphellaria aurata]|nr:hypothetical protein [Pseudocyphellaria aurata]
MSRCSTIQTQAQGLVASLNGLAIRYLIRPQQSAQSRSSPSVPAKREIIDLTIEDEEEIVSRSKRKSTKRIRRSSTRDEHSGDDKTAYKGSDEAKEEPGISKSPRWRIDETVRKIIKEHNSPSDDELASERKIPSKALSKQKTATHPPSWSKSTTPVSHPTQVYSNPKSHRPKPEEFPTAAPALTSPRIEIPIANATAKELKRHFLRNLGNLTGPPVELINEIDDSSPPVSFNFVNSSIIGEGVETVDEGFMSGCNCRDENGRNCGCEYRTCGCLQHSAKDERGNLHFPYSAGKNQGFLRNFYLNSRHHIYECNKNCNCRANCKNKVVQHGRQVRLEIFKTKDRGWGLRCPQDLQKGQFIDTYRGEIITNDVADRREKTRPAQDKYFMNFDKHTLDRMMTPEELEAILPKKLYIEIKRQVQRGLYETETFNDDDDQEVEHWLNPLYRPPYVCDGLNHGGPTKFMNHSCDPNCRVFTASYNHADEDIYDIAFFATEFIPAGTELTFDYKDEEDRDIITDEMADAIEAKNGYRPLRCLCGTKSCRGYFLN